jgi:hypothetical protein
LRVRSDEQLDEDAAATIADPAHDAETTMSNRDRSVKYLEPISKLRAGVDPL